MPDASVLISGSNPNTGIITRNTAAPTEFRMERLRPPYLMTTLAQPSIIKVPHTVQCSAAMYSLLHCMFPMERYYPALSCYEMHCTVLYCTE